jgi:predicted P-loop ATPase
MSAAAGTAREPPPPTAGDLRRLPSALAPLVARPRWVLWRWQRSKAGKMTKVPYQPNGAKAKSNDATTWSTYATVIAAVEKGDGIGYVLGDDIAAFDIDDCRDRSTGAIDPWAQALVDKVGSYAEITVSGSGLRIIGYGVGPKVHRKQPVANGVSLEAYRRAERYIVVTGNPLPGSQTAITNIDEHIDATVADLDAKKSHARTKKANGGAPKQANGSAEPDRREQDDHARQGDDDELDDIIRNGCGARFDGDRSRAVWFVINELLRRGHLPAVIVIVLLDQHNGISAHVYDQSAPREYAERQVAEARSKLEFAVDKNGIPFPNQANIRIALLKLGVAVRHDQFADRTLISGLREFGPALEDAAVDRIWLQLEQRFRWRPTKDLLLTVLQDTARLNGFHPVRDYLDDLRWDGTKRIDQWLTTYGGAEESEYSRAVGALMLVAAARRIRQPGCKYDEMTVLESDQGTNKSSALALLAVREGWFTDDLPLSVEGKQVIEQLRGRWIVEAAELSGMRRTDIEHLKAFLSRQIDRGRMAYGRLVTEAPRQCVIFGTTNNQEYLRDTTGNRRFWPVRIKAFDLDALARDREQLWAEAAVREATGANIRLDPSLWPAAAQEQMKRLTNDPFLDALQAELGNREGKIAAASVWEILDVRPGQRSQDQNRRVSDAMHKLGWHRPNKAGLARIGGAPVSAYVKGEQPWHEIRVSRSRDYGLTLSQGDEDAF